MGQVIGDLLPLALGVAISPIPIIAVILMLFAPRAGATSLAFLLGWVAGIIIATAVFLWLSSVSNLGNGSGGSAGAAWIKIALGALLAVLAVKQWRSRPAPGTQAALPGWMAAIDQFTTGKALGLGFVLAAVNPKNLAMSAAAGVAIGGAPVSGGRQAIAVIVFTIIAASTVAVPVLAYTIARRQMRGPLDAVKAWLQTNNATVMFILLLVIGVVLIGKGIGGL